MTGAFPQIAESQFDLRSGRLTIPPRERGSCPVLDLSLSQDGKRLIFVKAGFQRDLYVAELNSNGGLGPPRRFTLEGALRSNVVPPTLVWTSMIRPS